MNVKQTKRTGCLTRILHILFWIVLLIALLLAGGCTYQRIAITEMQSLPQTFEQTSQLLKGNQPFGDLPLIVITAGQTSAPGSTPFNEQYVPVPEAQIQDQLELAGQSSRGEQRILNESSHSGRPVTSAGDRRRG